ncbi:unnamed protein product [Brachionus calyciflorus]|uniref:EGF-like domain-containing protein n=1 Tax=Brachionus calyciflorus TaxID=104777 RepID=A0A814F2B5_9BILA|nr:unnamed protein product [Brachionus calyciflorus]
MRFYIFMTLICSYLASSIDDSSSYDYTEKYLTGAYCINTNVILLNEKLECPDADRDHFEDYDNLKLFCSDTSCKNCKDTDHTLIHGAAFECECNNTKQYYYCKFPDKYLEKRKELEKWVKDLALSLNISVDQLDNSSRQIKIEDKNISNNSNISLPVIDTDDIFICTFSPNHSIKIEESCVLNGTVNVCNCSSNFRNSFKACSNLFCEPASSCNDCKEDFYPQHGFGYECNCNGIKKDYVCKGQDELVEVYGIAEKRITEVSVIILQGILIFLLCSTIICCLACCVCYFSIKCCKTKISNLFKSDNNRYQMAPNELTPNAPIRYNRNTFELNGKNDLAPLFETNTILKV